MNCRNSFFRMSLIFWNAIAVILIMWVIALQAVGAELLFYPAVNYYAGEGPKSVAVGDFNGDGLLDIVTVGGSTGSVLLGNGDGSFQSAALFNVNAKANTVATNYIDGDRILDLVIGASKNVVPDQEIGFVSVHIGNGDGTFKEALQFDVLNPVSSIAIGDFNRDSYPDLTAAGDFRTTTSVSVMMGNGDGSFQNAVNYTSGNGSDNVAIGDLNGDTYTDLAVTNTDGHVSVLFGNGDGSFQEPIGNAVSGYNLSIAISDLNGDGILDLATGGSEGRFYGDINGIVSVLLGNGDGFFQDALYFETWYAITSIVIGELDWDGFPDITVSGYFERTGSDVSVLRGNGDGSFKDPDEYGPGVNPRSVAIGDLNGDACPDLVVANEGSDDVSIFMNTGFRPILEISVDIKPGNYPNSINSKSRGKIPVAILTTDDFDAFDVDPVTCYFADAYPLRWNMVDVDHDGDYDMLMHFKTQELVLNEDSTEATLECETFEGMLIIGTDLVNIVPKKNMQSEKAKKKK